MENESALDGQVMAETIGFYVNMITRQNTRGRKPVITQLGDVKDDNLWVITAIKAIGYMECVLYVFDGGGMKSEGRGFAEDLFGKVLMTQ